MTSPPTKTAARFAIPLPFVILVIVATVISISRDIIFLDKPVKKSVVALNHKADGSIVEHDEDTLKNVQVQQRRRRHLWEGLEDEWEEDDDDEVGEDITELDEGDEEDEWEDDE